MRRTGAIPAGFALALAFPLSAPAAVILWAPSAGFSGGQVSVGVPPGAGSTHAASWPSTSDDWSVDIDLRTAGPAAGRGSAAADIVASATTQLGPTSTFKLTGSQFDVAVTGCTTGPACGASAGAAPGGGPGATLGYSQQWFIQITDGQYRWDITSSALGTLAADANDQYGAQTVLRTWNPSNLLFEHRYVQGFGATGTATASGTGLLGPGQYIFFAGVGADIDTATSLTASLASTSLAQLTLTPVPLPAAAWLLLSGLAGVGVFARRRRVAV